MRIEREFDEEYRRESAPPTAGAPAPTLYEVRFFFVDDPEERVNAMMFGSAVTANRGDENLRALAMKLIRERPTGRALDLAETKLVVADVGVHKDVGGLGASYPDETLILFRPKV